MKTLPIIESQTLKTLKELLPSIKNDFSYIWKSESLRRHSDPAEFVLYGQILCDVGRNARALDEHHKFTKNMNYGGWAIYLIEDAIKRKEAAAVECNK
jgi:hypothetical protein